MCVCVCLCVQLKALQHPASRLLISSLTLFANTHPRALLRSVIVPVIAGDCCGPFQADVVTKLMKTVLSSDQHSDLFGFLLSFILRAVDVPIPLVRQ